MPSHPIRFGLATVAVVGLSAPFLMVGQASAGAVRTKGVNKNVDMSAMPIHALGEIFRSPALMRSFEFVGR